jgi:uncharacterized MAPEG superfamily protein
MNVALWCVFAGGLLPIAVVLIAKSDPGLDIHNPRDVHRTQSGLRKRAYGAHLNGLEAFPLFAAAVFACVLQGAPGGWIDALAAAWLAVRIAYTAAYLTDQALLRAMLWAISVLASAALFLLAALSG